MSSNEQVQIESARARSLDDTRKRILDIALEVLGQTPDAGMGDIASAAGAATITSLLILGVPEPCAQTLVGGQP